MPADEWVTAEHVAGDADQVGPPKGKVRRVKEDEQLAALARIGGLFERHALEYWLFGGWAVDFYAGSITRPHEDLDLAVWRAARAHVHGLLIGEGWEHAPEPGEDGYTGYRRGTLRLELAFLARDNTGRVFTPLREGRAEWPPQAFEDDTRELLGVRARLISLRALKADKAEDYGDPKIAAKDQADLATLDRLP